MADNGGGVLLYLDQEGRGNGIANKIRAYRLQAQGCDTYDADEILGFGPRPAPLRLCGRDAEAARRSRVAVMTNNPAEDRGAARRPASRSFDRARFIGRPTPRTCAISPPSATERATSSISRPWRSCRERDRIEPTARPAMADRRAPAWPAAGRCWRPFALGLAGSGLALAVGRGHDPVGRQGAFPGAAPVPGRRLHAGDSAVLEPVRLRGHRRRSPIRNR